MDPWTNQLDSCWQSRGGSIMHPKVNHNQRWSDWDSSSRNTVLPFGGSLDSYSRFRFGCCIMFRMDETNDPSDPTSTRSRKPTHPRSICNVHPLIPIESISPLLHRCWWALCCKCESTLRGRFWRERVQFKLWQARNHNILSSFELNIAYSAVVYGNLFDMNVPRFPNRGKARNTFYLISTFCIIILLLLCWHFGTILRVHCRSVWKTTVTTIPYSGHSYVWT